MPDHRGPAAHTEYMGKILRPRISNWFWAPVLFLLLILFFHFEGDSRAYQYPGLTILFGFVFTTCSSLLVAFLVGRSFLHQSSPNLLLLGCGALILGAGSIVATVVDPADINGQVAVHNISVWFSALCHLAGASTRSRPKAAPIDAKVWLGFAYLFSCALVWATKLAVTEGLVPPFFIQGEGGTLVRQVVLLSAIGMFGCSGALLKTPRIMPTRLTHWYALALWLIAIGLFGVFLQHFQGSLIGWTGRAAQYLGGVCMLVAAAVSVRESRAWRLTISAALQEKERQYENLVELAADGILIHGSSTSRMIEANPAFCSLLGYSLGEIRSMGLGDIVAPESRELFRQRLHAIEGEEVLKYEQVFMAKDHRRIPVEISSRSFMRDGALHVMSIIRDVTERKRAEEALNRLAQFPGENPDCVLRVSGGALLYANTPAQAWLTVLGRQPDGSVPDAVLAMAADANAENHPVESEIKNPDGTTFAVTAVRPKGEDYVNLYAKDITERKQVEAALHQSEKRFRALHESLRDAFVMVAMDGRIIDFNPLYCRMLGYSPEEMQRLTYQELTPERWHALEDRIVREQIIARGYSDVYEKEYRRKDGKVIPVELRTVLLRDEAGRASGMWGMVRDITERKQAEEKLRYLNENLEETVRERTATLVAAKQELEVRAEKLKQLAGELTMAEQRERKRLAKVLHDGLQQYLVAAKLQVGGLIGHPDDEKGSQTAIDVERLLSDAIAVSRSLAAELSPPILQDSGLLASLEWLSRWMSDKHGLKVEMQMQQMDAPLLTEDVKTLLFESVRELLFNAVKHAKTRSVRIDLAHENGRHLRVEVIDNGIGFDVAAVHEGNNPGGFGLFSIRERISLIGGRLEMDSSPGKGARFTLIAPLSAPAAKPHEKLPRDPADERPAPEAQSMGKTRILLVDDHAVMREGLARLLVQEPDFEVIGQANDGRQAVEQAASLMPDVVLMDISMPVMSGIEATRIIHRQHPEIRIVGLSLYTESERAKEMLEAGATFYLSKSGPPPDLKAAIRACMREGAGEAQAG
jgi:PAS domain S-box-containing protein